MSTMNSENLLTGSEWFAIGFQAQTALVYAYYCERDAVPPMRTTATEIGLPSTIRDGLVVEGDDGCRLTERGRAVLMQGDMYASRALRWAQ